MRRVKILGAGSIGNHLAHAARSCGWQVDLCDPDPAALARTRGEIYPARYGAWDESIGLYGPDEAPRGGYDAIFIGTPPDLHVDLAGRAVEEGPRLVHIEKPVCPPALEGAEELLALARARAVQLFVGYDLLLGESFRRAEALLQTLPLGPFETIDVETREHWGGIFAAHPWLDGPGASYLGFWRRGGGASCEHSHGLNMWQHLARVVGAGRVAEVTATLDYVYEDALDYDKLCLVNLRTERGLTGRCVQDVVTRPARKWARVQGRDGFVEWEYGGAPGYHVVRHGLVGQDPVEERFPARRPDDFIREIEHFDAVLDGAIDDSPIALARGLDTMLVIAAAHRSASSGGKVAIDYSRGYRPEALQ